MQCEEFILIVIAAILIHSLLSIMAFRISPIATLIYVLILSGCATSMARRTLHEPIAHPLQVVIVQSPNNVNPEALRMVFAPANPEISDETNKIIKSGMVDAEARAMGEMKSALTHAGITVLSNETISHSLNDLPISDTQKQLNCEQTQKFHLLSGADVLLKFRITDYGLTPREWRNWVIGFEIVSTVGIAAWAYYVPETRPLAAAYLVTESIEETAEAYSGFWALNKLSRPVRIEAELFDLHTGEMVWSDSNTGLAKVHLIRLFTNIDAATRKIQLEDATHESAEKLINRLQKSLASTGELSDSGGRP